ncbi:MAG: D-Ala-D-Ala carboxypeptidase family metallohydrolase [Bacteroidota bacterium]|nr:D-Ala-D-Ala carboxypeptidase family metallohydrolase [Bacteroidota bacterium]
MATILSKNFTLEEMLQSQTAVRKNINEQFTPSPEVISNLKEVCKHILQPLREKLGYPIQISSGYRCPRLNKAIGGASKSQHTLGMAIDIIDNKNGNKYLFDKIKELGLPYDQLINEFGLAWVHVSYNPKTSKQRNQVLLAVKNEAGKTVYELA